MGIINIIRSVIDSGFIQISQCPICASSSRRKIGLRGDRPIIELPKLKALSAYDLTLSVYDCKECRHIYVDPCPNEKKLFELYEE